MYIGVDPRILFLLSFLGMVISMLIVFLAIYRESKDLRRSIIASLFMGKAWALAMCLLGIDRPVLTIYMVNRRYPWIYREIDITANTLLIIAYATSILLLVFLPRIVEKLPELREWARW